MVSNGVPYDVAFSLDAETTSAYSIIFSSFKGIKFDYERWRFEEIK